jgi:hypothetical protein
LVRSDYLEQAPIELARDAFGSGYGVVLAAEFSAILRESADPACLAAKGIDPVQLSERGKDILVRYGAQMIQVIVDTVDMARYEAALASRFGRNARGEIAQLRNDPEVQKALSLGQPGRLAQIAGRIADFFSSFVALSRIKLSRPFSPLHSGDEKLLNADPSGASAAAVRRFVAQSKSQQLARYTALTTAAQNDVVAAADRDKVLQIGPTHMFRGAEKEIAALCIAVGQ